MPEEKKKLTYEELEAYANQTVAQAKRIYKENQDLVQEINNLRSQINSLKSQMNYADINLAFKTLELKENFSPEFIQKVVTELERVLTPMEKPEVEEKPGEMPAEGEPEKME